MSRVLNRHDREGQRTEVQGLSPGQAGTGPERGGTRSAGPILVVDDLSCEIATPAGTVRPVDHVSLSLERGKTLGIVGESGSGKSMLVRSLMGLTPASATITGKVTFDGIDFSSLNRKQQRHLLGAGIGMVFQNPMTSLNPVVPIGRQITEGMRFHLKVDRKEAKARALSLLAQVGISDATRRMGQYPYELSGGMRQRVTIAAALACDPKVLIADEATTALDVTVQKQILDLIDRLRAERDMSLVIISHDLGVMAGRADDIVVMYMGQAIESGSTRDIFAHYRHRYTEALLKSIPSIKGEPHAEIATIPGTVPSLLAPPVGCRFASRCSSAADECRLASPEVTAADEERHWYRCYFPAAGQQTVQEAEPVAGGTR